MTGYVHRLKFYGRTDRGTDRNYFFFCRSYTIAPLMTVVLEKCEMIDSQTKSRKTPENQWANIIRLQKVSSSNFQDRQTPHLFISTLGLQSEKLQALLDE